ncbi:SOS response-associated peptidase [Leptospira interrogans]|uniref:SOS response-associated peptidase n=2 Tax=Leptospira interrogans TaxID=173 RepID=UPI0002974293|nr:SOS response-associated peptidase [Leptospira interrogans]EKR15277.1 hypothetical protein LEP1GSC019_1656 [Leptospira interrogans serovar Pyrogenes str. 2006006960]
MCYHNSLTEDSQKLANRYNVKFTIQGYRPIYHENGFNHNPRPVITNQNPNEFQCYQWGLIPYWTKNLEDALKYQNNNLNVKTETVTEKKSFQEAILKQRCLVPSTGFFEYQEIRKKKYPYRIFLKKEEVFSLAGIFDIWTDSQTQKTYYTFTILTTEANPLMRQIHNSKYRMPLILPRGKEFNWIDPDLDQIKEIEKLFEVYPDTEMDAYTVKLENDSYKPNRYKYYYPELEQELLF